MRFVLLVVPVWKTQSWFPQLLHQVAVPCYLLPKTETLLKLPKDPGRQHPMTKMKMGAFSLSGNACMHSRKLPTDTVDIICRSWRDSTKRQHWGYQQKWMQFCCEKQIDPYKPDVKLVLEFLTGLYMKNLGYSALNTARSSITCSSFLSLLGDSCVRLSDHFLVKRFMMGVFFCQDQLYQDIILHGM